MWFSTKSRLQAEQERLVGERDKAIADCDRLRTQNTSTSTEQSELSQQRRELLSERDSLLAQQQAMHTEHEKVISCSVQNLPTVLENKVTRVSCRGCAGEKFSLNNNPLPSPPPPIADFDV